MPATIKDKKLPVFDVAGWELRHFDASHYWLMAPSGEGMQVSKSEFEERFNEDLQKYFDEVF